MLTEQSLHGLLLRGGEDVSQRMVSEFLPMDAMMPTGKKHANVLRSMVQIFSQAPERGAEPLVDGCVYNRPDSHSYADLSAESLYCNLKWGQEAYRKRYVHLYLKQCMIQAAVIARLHGAPSVTWRFGTPTSLPQALCEEYVSCVSSLTEEVSETTGMPLTPGQPPLLFLSENEADGAFFMHEDMVDVQNGYINIDLGGNTADLSLWLRAETEPSYEQSLEFGCHSILYESVERWPERLRTEYPNLDPHKQEELNALLETVEEGRLQPFKRDVAMVMFDRWMAHHASFAPVSDDHPGYLSSLTALSVSFLFFLCGSMLTTVSRDEELRAKMPGRLQVCFAGNGGRLLRLLTSGQLQRACGFASLWIKEGDRPSELIPVLSAQPKQEVALGVLYSPHGHTAREAVRPLAPQPGEKDADVRRQAGQFEAFFDRFVQTFAAEAQMLLERAIAPESGTLTDHSRQLMQTIVNNQFSVSDQNSLVRFVNCFMGIKKALGV